MKKTSIFGKYGVLITTIILFLVLTSLILGFNYFMSVRIAKESTVVNLISRQSILVQKMAKEVMNLDVLVNRGKNLGGVVFLGAEEQQITEELRSSKALFDDTLNSLINGGNVQDIDGETISIEALNDKDSSKILSRMTDVWQPYLNLVNSFLSDIKDSQVNKSSLKFAVDYASIFNTGLFGETNELIKLLERRIRDKAQIVQYIQIAGVVLAFLLFLLVALRALRQLIRSDAELSEARRETDDIMRTVSDGLFLVDKDLTIGNQYSSRLTEIIGQSNISGRSLIDLLGSMVSQKDLDTSKSFLGLLFNRKKKARLITDLNPLDQVEIQFNDEDGHFKNRYLNFNFSRVYDDKEVKKVLIGVSDITDKILLEQQLEREQAQNDQQMEMLTQLLHTDMGMLDSFLNHSYRCTERINRTLMQPDQSRVALQKKAKEIYIEVHSLKGEASALGLDGFVAISHDFEEKIRKISNQANISGNDFLPLAVSLEELIGLRTRVEGLISRLGGFAAGNKVKPISASIAHSSGSDANNKVHEKSGINDFVNEQESHNKLHQYFDKFANEIASRNGKQVSFDSDGLEWFDSNSESAEILRDISIQLIRNSVVHGIESPEDRGQLGKPQNGQVFISCKRNNEQLVLLVEDDGQGLDYEKIRKKAVNMGLVNAEKAESLTAKQLVELLFVSGFTTADESNEDAGRGIGLDIIRERVRSLGGRIQIQFKPQAKTRFTITIPVKEEK